MSDGVDNHVELTIIAGAISASREGFGTIGLLSHNCDTWGDGEASRSYTDVDDAVVDWATDSPEYLWMAKAFSQDPKPPLIKVLNAKLNKPTQRYALNLTPTIGLKDSHVYQLLVTGTGFDTETVEYTSETAETNDEVMAGMVAALNLVEDKNFTAAVVTGGGDTDTMTVTADDPGGWFSIKVITTKDFQISENHTDADVEEDLAAIALEDDDWFWLGTIYNSEAYVTTVAAWAQSQGKMYYFASNATADLATSDGTTGIGDLMRALAQKYVASDYHPNPAEFADAAVIGGLAGRKIGSWTAKFKRRSGVTFVPLTPTERTNLVARQMNFYEKAKGISLTSEGTTTGDGVNKWIDNVVNIDWLKDTIQTNVFSLQNSEAKIPYTDAGAAMIEAQVRAGLSEGVDNTVITEDFTVTVPKVEAVSTSDKALRVLPDVEFDCILQGAIHKVRITGKISP